MLSIDDIARAINRLEPEQRTALMDLLAQLNALAETNGESQSKVKVQAIEDAMKDEAFLTDLQEVMEDFSRIDDEGTPA